MAQARLGGLQFGLRLGLLDFMFATLKKPRGVHQPRWAVFHAQARPSACPSQVTGQNSEEALRRAIEEYEVPERERFRVSVQREA